MGSLTPQTKRAVRIGGASGGFSDRVHAITQLAKGGECDVVVGDVSPPSYLWIGIKQTLTFLESGSQK